MLNDKLLREVFSLVTKAPEEGEDQENSCMADIYSGFNGHIRLAVFKGSIGLPCIKRFSAALDDTLTGSVEQIVIDLSDVKKLSRTAVGELTNYAAAVLGRGKDLYLFKAPTAILQRLEELNLTEFFQRLTCDDDLINILPLE